MKRNIISVLIITLSFLYGFVSMAQFQVETNSKFKLGDKKISIYIDNKGRYNQANGVYFDTTTGNSNGLALEYGDSNSGGIFFNGNYMIIWNKGKYDRLLRIWDADGMASGYPERAYIDGEGSYYTSSDSNRKEKITTLDSTLNKITQLRGVEYQYKRYSSSNPKDSNNTKKYITDQTDKKYFGFLAEEVKNVFPEVVGSDENGNLFINYSGFVPLILQGIKEQQKIIDKQENNINTLTQQIQSLQDQIDELKTKIK